MKRHTHYFVICLVLLNFSLMVFAQSVDIQIDAGDVIRVGSEVLVRATLTNMDNESYVKLNSIKFLDTKRSAVMSENIDFNMKPVGKELSQAKETQKRYDSKKIDAGKYEETYQELAKAAENGGITKTYSVDLKKLKSAMKYGDSVTFIITAEYTQNGKTYTVSKPHTVTLLEPLQSQLERLEKLSSGYRDKTEEEKRIDGKCLELAKTN